MKTAQEIIRENQNIYNPNAGIKALAQAADKDLDGFCVMDKSENFYSSYREVCLDSCSCHRADYMLACVATRDPYSKEIGERAVTIYNEAMR